MPRVERGRLDWRDAARGLASVAAVATTVILAGLALAALTAWAL